MPAALCRSAQWPGCISCKTPPRQICAHSGEHFMGTNISTDHQSSSTGGMSRAASRKALPRTAPPQRESEKSLAGAVNGLSAHEGGEPGVRLDFQEIALSDVKHKRWDGIHGAFHVELGADYESARGGWIRDNLTSKLELESGRHYHVKFERGLNG